MIGIERFIDNNVGIRFNDEITIDELAGITMSTILRGVDNNFIYIDASNEDASNEKEENEKEEFGLVAIPLRGVDCLYLLTNQAELTKKRIRIKRN